MTSLSRNITLACGHPEELATLHRDERTAFCPVCEADTEVRKQHERESATPMDDGTILADCSCGATYSVPQGGNEGNALDTAHQKHAEEATR